MAAEFDVAGRLAEARQAIDNTQNYVWACHLLDFHNPDLTLHPGQVRDWFGSEDGMELRALDSDRAGLEAAAAAGEEALRAQRSQVARLAGAWAGSGADVAGDFLRAHCEAGASAAAAVGKAAEALAGLRDNLWQMVDSKVAAVVSIDDRSQAERPAWLSAAKTVTTGVGDRAKASELVDQQVKPFVDNDIRVDWLNAVRATIAAIAGSYDAATAGLTAQPDVVFDVPGDLGPRWAPTHDAADVPNDYPVESNGRTVAAAAPAAPAPTGLPPTPPPPAVPQAVAPSFAPVAPAPPAPSPMPADPSTPVTMPAAAPPAPAVPTMPEMPGAPLGGLSSLGQRLAEAIAGMLPTADDTVGDTSGIDEPPSVKKPEEPDEPTTDDEEPKDEEKQTDDAASEKGPEEKAEVDSEEPDGCPSDVTSPPPDPEAEPVAEPPPATEPPPAEPPPAAAPPPADPAPPSPPEAPPPDPASTPCEIAADELPQAGQ